MKYIFDENDIIIDTVDDDAPVPDNCGWMACQLPSATMATWGMKNLVDPSGKIVAVIFDSAPVPAGYRTEDMKR